MVAGTHQSEQVERKRSFAAERLRASARVLRPLRNGLANLGRAATSSLTRRIVILNLAGLMALVAGILYLNQFRAGLIDTRVQSLQVQGQIIAAAIAAQATVETDAITLDPDKLLELQAGQSGSPYRFGEGATDFPISPERVAPLLRRLISPTRTRARIYDVDGGMILDSRGLYMRGLIQTFDLPPLGQNKDLLQRWWDAVKLWYRRGELPVYEEIGSANGREYAEVASALNGQSASVVRVGEDGGLIVSVAVPVQRYRAILGSLLLSTESGDIDAIVQAERMAIMRVFLVAAGVTVMLSILLASTIAGPVRRLAAAAERVRRGVRHRRAEIPDLGSRKDEIGHLARVLSDMTNALYKRMEAVESFAADVSHELKNPLTSLRSAVETLPIAKTDEQRARLLGVIKHDVRRLDRLITDISDASRLDAELAREATEPVDMAKLLETVVSIARETRVPSKRKIQLTLEPGRWGKDAFYVLGHDSRLGQVFNNLIDNALSFSPPEGSVRVRARREPTSICVTVDDDGPGIRADNVESIFERFYTDRPEIDEFGQNSGLGLAITRQIVEAHRGTIRAENRRRADGSVEGARFTLILPRAELASAMSETVHATAVLVGADGVLIRGESGAGKSLLALALIERGACLISDDNLMLSACHGRLVATAPAAIAGQIELRGRGVVAVPHEQSGVIRLVVDIVSEEDLERMPEPHQFTATLLGIALPRQPVGGATERAVRLVQAALAAFASQPEGGLRLVQV